MFAWYNDIKSLTEKTGMERDAYVRRHTRSISQGSVGARSGSSDGGMEEDEADQIPFSPVASRVDGPGSSNAPERPKPGGRFPSDINLHRGLRIPLSPSSGTSSASHNALAAANILPGSDIPFGDSGHIAGSNDDEIRPGGDHFEYQNNSLPLQPVDLEYEPGYDRIDVLPRHSNPATNISQELPPQPELLKLHPDDVLDLDAVSSRPITTVPVTLSDVINEIKSPMGPLPAAFPSESTLPISNRAPSDIVTQASDMTSMSDSTAGAPYSSVELQMISQNRILTITDLHVPGEFP